MTSLPRNFGSAMDLSALKNSGNPTDRADIAGIDVTKENLMQDLLPASNSQVVILICWSPRSLESKKVMATLGKFHEQDGISADGSNRPNGSGWLLGNVNVDSQVEVAQALQVQTVPLALAIIQEQLVPLFETAPTDAQLRTVIDKVLALAAERGVGLAPSEEGRADDSGLAPEERLEPEEIKALTALEARDFLGAKAAYQEWLNRTPGQILAQLGMAQVELLIRIDGLDSDHIFNEASTAPENIDLQIQAADCEMAQGNYVNAFDRLISTIKVTAGDDRKRVQGHLVGLFVLVDPADPDLKVARQKLASALF